ncbi:MAG: hypothetical protein R2769_05785 [Saprospiraceae bacterium]
MTFNQAMEITILQDFTVPLDVPVNDYNDDVVSRSECTRGQPWIDALGIMQLKETGLLL